MLISYYYYYYYYKRVRDCSLFYYAVVETDDEKFENSDEILTPSLFGLYERKMVCISNRINKYSPHTDFWISLPIQLCVVFMWTRAELFIVFMSARNK